MPMLMDDFWPEFEAWCLPIDTLIAVRVIHTDGAEELLHVAAIEKETDEIDGKRTAVIRVFSQK